MKFTYNNKGDVIAKGAVLAKDGFTQELLNKLNNSLIKSNKLRAEALDMYKALDTQTAVEGGNLIETILFRGVLERVRQFGTVAPLFRDLQMPSATYELPVELADAIVYLTPENTTVHNQISYSSTNPTFTKSTLIAQKITGMTHLSGEIEEDSVIDIISYVVDNHAIAIAFALDQAILDGDADGTHQDGITDPRDVRTAFDGLRKLALGVNSLSIDNGGTAITLAKMLEAKSAMGKYAQGTQLANLRWIVSGRTYSQLENLAFATTNNNMQAFSYSNGQLAAVAGIPIITNEIVRNDLASTGFYTGTGALSYALLVNTSRFVTGTRASISFESEREPRFDQTQLYSRLRKGFTSIGTPSATESSLAIIRNIS
jgi:HK97 family phage major capsid protein